MLAVALEIHNDDGEPIDQAHQDGFIREYNKNSIANHGFNYRGRCGSTCPMRKLTHRTVMVDTSTLDIRQASLSVQQENDTKYCSARTFLLSAMLVFAECVLNSSPHLVRRIIIYSCFSEVTNESFANAANYSSSMKA
jgi:hypothetical protein